MRILFTCFDSVRYPHNPSKRLLGQLMQNYDIVARYEVLHATFNYCDQWLENLNVNDFDKIISFGASHKIQTFHLEQFAKNRYKDLSTLEVKPIIKGGVDRIKTKFDLKNIHNNLGIEKEHVQISTNAGLHVCGYIYYIIGTRIMKTKTKMIFVHVPLDGPFSWKYQIFDKIVNALLKDIQETNIEKDEKIISSIIEK